MLAVQHLARELVAEPPAFAMDLREALAVARAYLLDLRGSK